MTARGSGRASARPGGWRAGGAAARLRETWELRIRWRPSASVELLKLVAVQATRPARIARPAMAAHRGVVASAGRSRTRECARSLARLRLALHHPRGRAVLCSVLGAVAALAGF